MTIRYLARILLALLVATALGCGGGGGGSGGGTTDTTPPTISISAPTNNLSVNGTVAITANASDNVGVSKVEFYINGSLQATTTTAPYSFSWNTLIVPNGTYSLTAKAYDAANNSATSSPVLVTVNGPAKATLTLSIPSLPASTLVGGVKFTINLPPGVSPAVLSGANDASGSVTLTGGAVGSLPAANFTTSPTVPQIVTAVINATGFGAGNFVVVNCVIAPGTTVSTNDFLLSNIQVFDSTGTLIPSATVNIAVQLS